MIRFVPLCVALFATQVSSAKGLKDLKPDDPVVEDVKKKVEEKAKEILPPKEPEKKPVKEEIKKKKEVTGDAEVIVDTNIAYSSIKGSKGSWDAGFSGDFRVGIRFMKLMDDRLHLYGTYHFLPIDVIVTESQTQYMGVVEQQLFGVEAKYLLQKKLHLTAHGEIGLASSKLTASTSVTSESDLEESGVGVLLGGGAQWQVMDKVHVGGHLSLGVGSFQTSQVGFTTTLTL